MTKLSVIIKKLQKLQEKNGDKHCEIYKSFSRETVNIKVEDIYFDKQNDKIQIGIYS